MKKTSVRSSAFLLTFLMIFGWSCKKEDQFQSGFDMFYSQEFSIPAGLSPFLVHHFYFKNVNTQFASLLEQNKRTEADVKAILPAQIELTGIFGDGNFDFIEEATLYIYPESEPTARIEVAYRFPTPLNPGNSLPLIPGLADAKKLMKNDRVSFDLALRLRKTTPDETTTRLDVRFRANY